MASRLNLARMGAVILGASTALMLTAALPASADGTSSGGSSTVTGKINGHNDDQSSVTMLVPGKSGKQASTQEPTALMQLDVAGQIDEMYCVELTVHEGGVGSVMVEQPWGNFPTDPNSNFGTETAARINWVLHNSFPMIDLQTLSAAAHTQHQLTGQEAVAGTQAAIWSYSEKNVTIDPNHNNADVLALFKYLTNGPSDGLAQPTAKDGTVSVSPQSQSGHDGQLIGPFTVGSNLGVPLTLSSGLPKGVTLTDGNGKPVDTSDVVDGTKVYFDVAAGTDASDAWFKVTGQYQVGQLFVGQDVAQAAAKPGGIKTNCKNADEQSLIVAKSSAKEAMASAKWTEQAPTTTTAPTTTAAPTTTSSQPVAVAPTTTTPPQVKTTSQSLPFTGVSLILPVGLAVILIGAGATFLILQRRRRRA